MSPALAGGFFTTSATLLSDKLLVYGFTLSHLYLDIVTCGPTHLFTARYQDRAFVCVCVSRSVVSYSLQPHGLLCP